jgi:hypothetical protein
MGATRLAPKKLSFFWIKVIFGSSIFCETTGVQYQRPPGSDRIRKISETVPPILFDPKKNLSSREMFKRILREGAKSIPRETPSKSQRRWKTRNRKKCLAFENGVTIKITMRRNMAIMFDLRNYVKKGSKFIVIGAIGAVVNWGILVFLVQEFRMFYLTAEIIATIIAFLVNFNGNILVKNINVSKEAVSKGLSTAPDVVQAKKAEDVTPGQAPGTSD